MHKKIGILGGLTPESTITYYMHIVHRYQTLYGDHGYPECVIYGVSFQQYEDWMKNEDWDSIEDNLFKGLKVLENAGVDFSIIATNTMHLLFDKLQSRIQMPLISIIDAVAESIMEAGFKKVGLLGTEFTMNQPFYQKGLLNFNIETIVPGQPDQNLISHVIYDELSKGILREESRQAYLKIIDKLVEQGAEGVVLGCTEIPLLVRQQDTDIKIFDTTTIHAEKALQHAIL
jgi:aspartate racemase